MPLRRRLTGAGGPALAASILLALLTACATPQAPPFSPLSPEDPSAASVQPEAATVRAPSTARSAAGSGSRHHGRQAIVTAHPLATAAGLEMLRAGGSAVDAAIAAQAMLGLVEPQSSGIGGGAFLLVQPANPSPTLAVEAWDGRETAPASARPDQFLSPDGQPLHFDQVVATGPAVATPGAMRMLEAAHRRHGKLPWARLFEPAIHTAEQGFAVTPRLAGLIASDTHLRQDIQARKLFFHADGRPLQVGDTLRNPGYAWTLRRIAEQGADALHHGPVGEAIVRAVRTHLQPGSLSASDLAAYRPARRPALCMDWRRWVLCGMPPPSSGMLTLGQILGLLEAYRAPAARDLEPEAGRLPSPGAPSSPRPTVDFLHAYTEAMRLAFADRNRYIADPDFVPAPGGDWRQMWAPDYLSQRARTIGPTSMGTAQPGRPAGTRLSWSDDRSPELPATSHLSIADAHGMVVSMTTTIEAQFGSRILVAPAPDHVGGFLLNNEMTDFSFVPEQDGQPVANRIEPGKRPRSSMSPTLVFEKPAEGQAPRLVASLGSPGGAVIISYVARTLLAQYAWGLDPQTAVELPHVASLNGPTLLERGRWPVATLQALKARGHTVREVDLTSGLHSLSRQPDGTWVGGVDPRREGAVDGD